MTFFDSKTGEILNEYEIRNTAVFQMYKGWTPFYNLKGEYFGAILHGEFYSLKTIFQEYGYENEV
jgi:hypothetical protein